MSEMNASAAFNEEKQLAIYGWTFKDKAFGNQVLTSIKPEWFSSIHLAKLYSVSQKVFSEFARLPTAPEVVDHSTWLREDARVTAKCQETLERALAATQKYGVDILRSEMTEFIYAAIFQQAYMLAGDKFNAKDVRKAWDVLENSVLSKVSVSFEGGMNKGFRNAQELIIEEADERKLQQPKMVKYGVDYLDDSLMAIIPNDLIVIGAKSGAGKTNLARAIAESVVAQPGEGDISFFALEAENYEIERRIKYGMIAEEYYKRGINLADDDRKKLSYTNWRIGNVSNAVLKLEKELQDNFRAKVKNFKTFYRTSSIFDGKALEQQLLRVVGSSKLIVLDHLHYVDTMEGENENEGYKRIVKSIRDIVLRHGVPVIVIAHLRKNQGGLKGAPLINSIEDFHGTSDISKIATTCIMMAPAYDRTAPIGQKHLWPTYMSIVKSRLEGSRTRFAAVCNFNAHTSAYAPGYILGKLSSMNQVFDEIYDEDMPEWAFNAEKIKAAGYRMGQG